MRDDLLRWILSISRADELHWHRPRDGLCLVAPRRAERQDFAIRFGSTFCWCCVTEPSPAPFLSRPPSTPTRPSPIPSPPPRDDDRCDLRDVRNEVHLLLRGQARLRGVDGEAADEAAGRGVEREAPASAIAELIREPGPGFPRRVLPNVRGDHGFA